MADQRTAGGTATSRDAMAARAPVAARTVGGAPSTPSTPAAVVQRTPGTGRRLVTAEAVELEIPTASVGLRMLALLLDLFVLALAVGVVGWVAFQLVEVVDDAEAIVVVAITVVAATPFLVTWAMEGVTRGSSLGKGVTGLKVVTVEGAPIGWKHAGIRAAMATFEIWATFGFVAFMTAMVSARGQRLGDMTAGTLVVRRANQSIRVAPVRFVADPAVAPLVATLDLSGLDDADYHSMRSALLRQGLDPTVHAHLCGEVVRSLWPRISSGPLPTNVPAPMVLNGMAAAFQDQHTGLGSQVEPTAAVWSPLGR
ncbi:MAG TPA: RDD family protein [Nitriliruptoraceae bacterium]|nr:RDD family protein [Nitriliruptoraceae bacterium]